MLPWSRKLRFAACDIIADRASSALQSGELCAPVSPATSLLRLALRQPCAAAPSIRHLPRQPQLPPPLLRPQRAEDGAGHSADRGTAVNRVPVVAEPR